ncbi:MAG TPA: ABC transporter permease [Ilumatobacteraceae bacterium]|nr:ABC transporter permease [Ilumatobacteraceae bacterium]
MSVSSPAAARIAARNWAFFRHVWKANLFNSLLQPVLYLLAMGLGVGALINDNSSSTSMLHGLSYAAFVGPGLLATTTMMIASVESMWPVYDGVAWGRHYESVVATPLTPGDIAWSHALWMAVRSGLGAITVALAMALFPAVRSLGLVPATAVATLGGVAIGMPLAAWAISRQREGSFPIIQRFVIVPLFLFGGAFFPIEQLPLVLRWVGYASPLWHNVELCRALVSATPITFAGALGHIAYLAGWALAGGVVMARCARRRLYP